MRGKDFPLLSCSCLCRITPAYAGKRKRKPNGMLQLKDHPRLCGEKKHQHRRRAGRNGSPPPMRGKGRDSTRLHLEQRITPAYAGKRQKGKLFVFCLQDHPRLCGEKKVTAETSTTVSRITPAYAGKSVLVDVWRALEAGSPPPMRGKVILNEMQLNGARITPAYAGKRDQTVVIFPC